MSGATKFVEVVSSDSDESDLEVQFVPFVKPTPPVIDIIESSSDEGNRSSNTSPKKKKKERKKKKSKTSRNILSEQQNADDEHEIIMEDVCSTESVSCDKNAAKSPSRSKTEAESPSSAGNVGKNNERMQIHAVHTVVLDMDSENDTSLNAEPIASTSQSSRNAGVISSRPLLSESEAPALIEQTSDLIEESVPCIRIASSIFEPNNDALEDPVPLSTPAPVVDTVSEGVIGLMGVDVGASLNDNFAPAVTTTAKSTGRGKKGSQQQTGQTTTRKRKATANPRTKLAARQRTNEEIFNFLTTLGIYESTETPPVPPPTKRVRKKKGQASASNDLLSSDVLSTSLAPQPSEQDSMLPPPPLFENPLPEIPEVQRKPRKSKTLPLPPVSVVPIPILEQNTSTPASPVVDLIVDNIVPVPVIPASYNSTSDAESLLARSRAMDYESTPRLITVTHNESLTIKLPNTNAALAASNETVTVSREDTITLHQVVENVPTSSASSSQSLDYVTLTSDQDVASQNANQEREQQPFFPVHWSTEMIKYYDTPCNENMRRDRVLASMPDDRGLWRTREGDFLVPKISRRVRCVNCNQWGHVVRNCTEDIKKPVCRFCGNSEKNSHGRSCRNEFCLKAKCLNCGSYQKKISNGCSGCLHLRNTQRCTTCDIFGHRPSQCPDNWRRFWSTTTMDKSSDGFVEYYGTKTDYRLHKDSHCANCGTKGHNYFNCRLPNLHYAHQNPKILIELPRPPKSRSNIAETITSESNATITFEQMAQQLESIPLPLRSRPQLQISHSVLDIPLPPGPMPQPSIQEKLPAIPVFPWAENSRSVIVDNSEITNAEEADCNVRISIVNETVVEEAPPGRIEEEVVPSTSTSPESIITESSELEKASTPTADAVATTKDQISSCSDYPDCNNKPKVGTSCRSIVLVSSEHKMVLQAQEEGKILEIVQKYNTEITVLHNQNVIHINGGNLAQIELELWVLISVIKTKKDNAPQTLKIKPQSVSEPEVITLEEEDDEEERKKERERVLTVTLLESEWELISAQSFKPGGLITSLTKQFRVSIVISKEMLTVQIQNGIFSDRKLAQKNIVFWLECQAANVDYVMQFKIDEPTFSTPASWTKKNKRPNVSPHPQSKKFSFKKKRRMNSPVTPASILPNPRNNSQSQNNRRDDNSSDWNLNNEQQRNRNVPYPDPPRENMNYRYNNSNSFGKFGNQQIPNPNNGYFDFNSPLYTNQQPHHSGPRNSQVGNDNQYGNNSSGQRRGGHRGRGGGRGRSKSPRQNRNFNGRSPTKKPDGRNLLRYYNANNDN